MHLIRKAQVRWLLKGDVAGQRQFIHNLFSILGVTHTNARGASSSWGAI